MASNRNLKKYQAPKNSQDTSLQKGLGSIQHLISTKRIKRKQPQNSPMTLIKMNNTLLMQMYTRGSPQKAEGLLGEAGKLVYDFAKEILKCNAPKDALTEFVKIHKHDHGRKLFTVSPSTLTNNLQTIRQKDADLALSKQIVAIQANLQKQGLWSSTDIVSVDPTDTYYRGKYRNQYHNWGITGQKPTYKRCYKELTTFSSPNQFITGSTIAPVLSKDKKSRSLPLWISQIQGLLRDSIANNQNVPLIMGDREYYSSLGMAFSYFGLWLPENRLEENPRLLCPTKHWGNNALKKWEFLLNRNSPKISVHSMEIEHYQAKFLGGAIHRLPQTLRKTRFLIPVARVAVFDAYGNGHRIESLDWGRNEAYKIKNQIRKAQTHLHVMETKYLQFQQQKSKKSPQLPKYKGAGRRVFKDKREKIFYQKCMDAHEGLQRVLKKKTNLLKRLMFFTLSLRENESIVGKEEEFLTLIRYYHQRWGIECAFKDLRGKFWLRTNSRKPSARHVRYILGCMMYNAWHYRRLMRIGRVAKQSEASWKPYDDQFVPFRKKYERQFRPILTAQGFILEEMKKSLRICVKQAVTCIS